MGMSAAHCRGIVGEMSGNIRVSGEWSPCITVYITDIVCLSFSVLFIHVMLVRLTLAVEQLKATYLLTYNFTVHANL